MLYFITSSLQLETIEENNTNGRKMKYNYNVIPGVCTLEKYGIYLAKLSWPETIIEYAENCFSILSNANKVHLRFFSTSNYTLRFSQRRK